MTGRRSLDYAHGYPDGADELPPEEVRAELSRILGSPEFSASPKRREMLTFVIEETLAGRGGRLKGYTIAVSIFGREEGFDPQEDPIVRMEARRLRQDLANYYVDAGSEDPIRITIPKGGYVPHFEPGKVQESSVDAAEEPREAHDFANPAKPAGAELAAPPPSGAHPWRLHSWKSVWVVGLAVVLIVGTAAALTEWFKDSPATGQDTPGVIVQSFAALTGDEDGQLLAIGLTNAVVDRLTPFDGLQVYADIVLEGRPTPALSLPPIPVMYVITGSVGRTGDNLRVTARLTERASGRVLWSQTYNRPLTASDVLTIEDEISTGIASELAQVYGLIHLEADRQFSRDRPETLAAYECVQRAFAYRLVFAPDQYPAVRSCLETAVKQDPGYADAWAMLAFAHLDAIRFHFGAPEDAAAESADALSAAKRAIDLAPERVRPLQALAAVRFMMRDFAEAERLQRRAIALNRNDPESLAQLGWRLVARDRSAEGRALLREAIDRSLRSPTWYHMSLAVGEFDLGALDAAYAEAVLGSDSCCGLGHAVLAVMAAETGKPAEAKAALEIAIAQYPTLLSDPSSLWATWHDNPALIERLNAGLEKAGLPVPDSTFVRETGQSR